MILSALIFIQDDKSPSFRNLPLTTPNSAPAKICPRTALVSVSEYRSASSKQVTRVFRYTFRGEFSNVVNTVRKKFKKADGWQSSDITPFETDFWRITPQKHTTQTGLILLATRFVPDKQSPTGWTSLPFVKVKGWVSISWNEQVNPLSNERLYHFSRNVGQSEISPLIPIG